MRRIRGETFISTRIYRNRHFCSSATLSGHYDVVIAGGGVIGTSVGFHLSKHSSNIKPLLLEQSSLTSGTTWHAAGLLGSIRASSFESSIAMYTSEYLKEIELETGYSPSIKSCSSLSLSCTPQRTQLLQRTKSFADINNIDINFISIDEAKELCPYLIYDNVIDILHIKQDGSCTSSDVTQCYAKGMTQNGGKISENTQILNIEPINYGLNGFKISTNNGIITCNSFVNCSGQWSKQLGLLSNINIPLASLEHFYIVSKPSKDINQHINTMMPVVRDPDSPNGYIYFREWSGGMLCGTFEKNPKIAFNNDIDHNIPPNNFQFGLFDDDWDHFEPLMDDIINRCPLFENAEIQMINGPESFTIDHKCIIGDVNELFNYYIATGMNSGGITSSCGIGKLLSNWIIYGYPNTENKYKSDYKYNNKRLYDIEKKLFSAYPNMIDIKRFHSYTKAINVQINGAKETLSSHTAIPIANSIVNSAQNIRASTVYHYQKYKQNAKFIANAKNGYSIAMYFGDIDIETKQKDIQNIYSKAKYQNIVDNEINTILDKNELLIFDRSVDTKFLLISNNNNINELLLSDSDDYYVIKYCNPDLNDNTRNVYSITVIHKQSGNIELCGDIWELETNKYLLQSPNYQYSYLNKKYLKECVNNNNNNLQIIDVSAQYSIFHIVGHNSLKEISKLCHSSSIDKLKLLDTNNENNNEYNNRQFVWIDIGSFQVGICGVIPYSQNYCEKQEYEYQLLVSSDYASHFYEYLCESDIVKPGGYLAWDLLRIINRRIKYDTDLNNNPYFVQGMIKYMDSNDDNDLIPLGGEPILTNNTNEYIGSISSIRYYGNVSKSFYNGDDCNNSAFFIANVNDDKMFNDDKFKIRLGNDYIDCILTKRIDVSFLDRIVDEYEENKCAKVN